MARYGYGMSVSGTRKSIVSGGGAAPSGIPISTETITVLTVGDTSAAITGAYNKQSDTEWWRGGDLYFRYDGTWYFQNEDTNTYSYHPTGTNPNLIPDTGWNDGITITAA